MFTKYLNIYYEYKKIGACPYDVTFASGVNSNSDPIHKECSGQGNCNRATGLCECYPGFEGTACQRTSCPNDCSNHGICTSVQYVDVAHSDKFYLNYYNEPKDDSDYSFVCVCDSNYFGPDCSYRKCPLGYYPTSDCDLDPQGPQVIILTPSIDADTNKPKDKISGFNGYAKFRDLFGREWFTDLFNALDEAEWTKAINKLPYSVINLKDVKVECFKKDGSSEKCDSNDLTKVTISIWFGVGISGRQHEVELINNEVLRTTPAYSNYYFPSGYHGMKRIDPNENLDANIAYSVSYIRPPTSCSSNGICDTNTGLCTCFRGYYGPSCDQASEVM